MTIGPEPTTRIFWMSALRGNYPLHEPVEEMASVVRPRAGLGVVLHRRRRHVAHYQPLHGAVVEVQLLQLGRAEVGLPADRLVGVDRPLPARAEHREAVVLRGDLDPPGLEVLDRVVGAAVAEREL